MEVNMKYRKFQIFIAIALFSVLLLNPLYAQKSRGKGRLKGKVLDEAENPIENAKVVLLFEDEITKFETTTDKKGIWSVIALGTGKFRVTASADGYIPTNTLVFVRQLSKNPPVILKLKAMDKAVVSEDLVEFLKEGNKLFKEKKYDESIAAFQKVIEKAPEVYQINYKIGDCYREKGDLDKAIEIYEEVIKKAEEKKDIATTAKALATIGGIYLVKQELGKAQSYFKRSIEKNPEDEIVAYNVGEINLNSNNMDDAITYFKMASKIKPTWNVPFLKLGYAYLNKGDFATAVKMFNKVIELDPDSQEAITAKEIIKSLPKQK